MTTDQLENLVREALAWRADHTPVIRGAAFDGRRPADDEPLRPRPQRRVWLAAAAIVALAIAGLVALQVRPDPDGAVGEGAMTTTSMPRALSPTSVDAGAMTYTVVPGDYLVGIAEAHCVTAEAIAEFNGWVEGIEHTLLPDEEILIPPGECGDDGRLALPADSEFVVVSATDVVAPAAGGTPDTRIYATSVPNPETGPALIVTAHPDIAGPPGPHPETVPVRGVTGDLTDTVGGSRTLVFYVDGWIYSLTAYNLSDAQLLAFAEVVEPSPDGNGAVVPVAVLPGGMTEQLVGWQDTSFVSDVASQSIAPRAEFHDPATGAAATYVSYADPDLGRLNRLNYDTVVDVTVDGRPGYVGEHGPPDLRTVVWSTESRTYFLTGEGFTADELVALAESLQPVTAEEWAAMVTAVPETTIG